MLSLLWQVTQPTLPPITVVVQQPSTGTPEWIQVLITAAIGACVGIVSNIAVEYVKPYIKERIARRNMERQISAELMQNLRLIEAGYKWLQEVQGREQIVVAKAMHIAKMIPPLVKADRFTFFNANQKALMYEYDPEDTLSRFYRLTGRLLQMVTSNAAGSDIEEMFGLAMIEGENMVMRHKLAYKPQPVTKKEISLLHESRREAEGP